MKKERLTTGLPNPEEVRGAADLVLLEDEPVYTCARVGSILVQEFC